MADLQAEQIACHNSKDLMLERAVITVEHNVADVAVVLIPPPPIPASSRCHQHLSMRRQLMYVTHKSSYNEHLHVAGESTRKRAYSRENDRGLVSTSSTEDVA